MDAHLVMKASWRATAVALLAGIAGCGERWSMPPPTTATVLRGASLGDGSRCGLVLEVKGGSPHVKDAKPEPEITIAIPQPDDYKPSPVTHEPCSPATLGEIGKTWTIQPKALLSHFGLWGSTPRTAYYTSSDMNILNPSFNGSFPQQPPTREKKKRPAMSLPPGG